MFKVFSFLALGLLSTLVYGQDDSFDPGTAIEINQSKENINEDPFLLEDPTLNGDLQSEDPNAAGEELSPAAETTNTTTESNVSETADEPAAIPAEDETVLVRERVDRDEHTQGNGTEDNLVEVRSAHDIFLPYKQRQDPWGFLFSLGGEFIFFPNLVSQYDFDTYQDMFGSTPNMAMSLELGPKYNMSWGSLGLTFGYASLDISDDRLDGVEAGLKFNRYSATLAYYLDTLWSEAYFVPYVAGGAWQADYEETSDEYPDETRKYTTDVGYHWRVGGLFGLGWLEPNTALRSRRTAGLQEAFLNIYVSSTYMAESDPDPDLESEMDIGATIVLEF